MLGCNWKRGYKCCIVEQGTCKGPGEARSCRRSAHKSTARYRASRQTKEANIHLQVLRTHQVDATEQATSQSTADHIVCLTCRQACRHKIIARQLAPFRSAMFSHQSEVTFSSQSKRFATWRPAPPPSLCRMPQTRACRGGALDW